MMATDSKDIQFSGVFENQAAGPLQDSGILYYECLSSPKTCSAGSCTSQAWMPGHQAEEPQGESSSDRKDQVLKQLS